MAENPLHKLFEEIILVALILLNVGEFFDLLPGIGEFIKAVISVSGLAYVLYKASLSDIFFGHKKKWLDFALMTSYILLIVNKFVQFSWVSLQEAEYLEPFFQYIIDHATSIEMMGFFLGTLSLLFLAIYVAMKLPVYEPSILHALHSGTGLKKFFLSFIVLISFYLIFFNLVMEWLTLIIDAPLVVLAIFLYLFKFHGIGQQQEQDVILYRIADFVENFVEEFTLLFHSRKTIFLGISALLVLHLVTDVGAFVIPYTIGTETLYHSNLGVGHEQLSVLFTADKVLMPDKTNQILLFIGYVFNIVSVLFLMIFPVFIWYVIYLNHTTGQGPNVKFPDSLIALFYASMVYFFFLPIFNFSFISADSVKNILGVDIQTQSILASGNSLILYSGIALSVFFGVYILSKIMRHVFFIAMSIGSTVFFGYYIYNFFMSLMLFYLDVVNSLFSRISFSFAFDNLAQMYLLVFNFLFLVITAVFYIGGYTSFLISMFKE